MDPAKVKYRVAFGTSCEAVSCTFPYQLVQMTNRVAKTQENLQREQKANYNGEKKHNKADGSIKRCAEGQISRRLVSRMKIGALGLAEASAPRSTFLFFFFSCKFSFTVGRRWREAGGGCNDKRLSVVGICSAKETRRTMAAASLQRRASTT